MATPRQIAANQRNAQKSTGPKTEAGKERSRRNAFKHGLAGTGVVCDEAFLAQLEEYVAMWRPYYPTRTEGEDWLLEQYALATLKLNLAQAEVMRITAVESHRAEVYWEKDRLIAMDRVAKKLKKEPAATVRQLEACLPGCRWLIIEWKRLEAELEEGVWNDVHENMIHDLLGDRPGLRAKKPWKVDPKAFVARQIARLEREAAIHVETEEMLREGVRDALPMNPESAVEAARRYELIWFRRSETYKRRLEQALREELTETVEEPQIPLESVVPPLRPSAPTPSTPPQMSTPSESRSPGFSRPTSIPADALRVQEATDVLDISASGQAAAVARFEAATAALQALYEREHPEAHARELARLETSVDDAMAATAAQHAQWDRERAEKAKLQAAWSQKRPKRLFKRD